MALTDEELVLGGLTLGVGLSVVLLAPRASAPPPPPPSGSLLRQSTQVAGPYATLVGGVPSLVARFPQGVQLGSYIIACQVIVGPENGLNGVFVGASGITGQDIGIASGGMQASCDILWLKVTSNEVGATDVTFQIRDVGSVNYGACWAGEYLRPDPTRLTRNNGYDGQQPVDTSMVWSGNAQDVILARGGLENTCNYTPEAGVWALGLLGPAQVVANDNHRVGFVSDGAHVGLLVLDNYFNAVGEYAAHATLSAPSPYVAANLTWITQVYPT